MFELWRGIPAGHLLASSLTEELILTAMLQEEQVDRDLNYFIQGYVSL